MATAGDHTGCQGSSAVPGEAWLPHGLRDQVLFRPHNAILTLPAIKAENAGDTARPKLKTITQRPVFLLRCFGVHDLIDSASFTNFGSSICSHSGTTVDIQHGKT